MKKLLKARKIDYGEYKAWIFLDNFNIHSNRISIPKYDKDCLAYNHFNNVNFYVKYNTKANVMECYIKRFNYKKKDFIPFTRLMNI